MAIQLRRGAKANYDASKMLSGEVAIFTDTDEMVFKGTNSVKVLGTNSQTLTPIEKGNVRANLDAPAMVKAEVTGTVNAYGNLQLTGIPNTAEVVSVYTEDASSYAYFIPFKASVGGTMSWYTKALSWYYTTNWQPIAENTSLTVKVVYLTV